MHPVLIAFGPIEIRFYGLMYVVAIIVGSYLLKKEIRRKNIPLTDDDTMNFVLWVVVVGIIFARIYYVVFNPGYYLANPIEIPAIWHGGLAIHGGIIGGLLGGLIFVKRHGLIFWRLADAMAPSLILGQCFGRFGNFMNGDAHGAPTDMPWGIVFPPESIAGREFPGIPLHPSMLYELGINLTIFCVLWFVLKKRDYKDGFLFGSYLILYSIGRFFVEMTRADSLMLGSFRAAQVVSLTLVIGVLALIIYKKLWQPSLETSAKS
jgi:phosphatidylglycerol:prolipoprotein diacylglycerol transferase